MLMLTTSASHPRCQANEANEANSPEEDMKKSSGEVTVHGNRVFYQEGRQSSPANIGKCCLCKVMLNKGHRTFCIP